MQIRSATFVTSAAKPHQFLRRPIPHVVFAGRSNVGKSSLLNKLLNRKSLAKTSATPGKTRLVNYFLVNDRFFFVDVPGYGYARVSRTERAAWGKMMDAYFTDTPTIAMVFLLLDIRRDPNEDDRQMIEYLAHLELPFRLLLTKADKLSRNQTNQRTAAIAKSLGLDKSMLIATSAEKATGLDRVWNVITDSFSQEWDREAKEAAL